MSKPDWSIDGPDGAAPAIGEPDSGTWVLFAGGDDDDGGGDDSGSDDSGGGSDTASNAGSDDSDAGSGASASTGGDDSGDATVAADSSGSNDNATAGGDGFVAITPPPDIITDPLLANTADYAQTPVDTTTSSGSNDDASGGSASGTNVSPDATNDEFSVEISNTTVRGIPPTE